MNFKNTEKTNETSIYSEVQVAGKTIRFETQQLAKQASAAVFATMDDNQVLTTLTISNNPSDKNFLPLAVDYVEKFYAAGRIPGSYTRREGRPSEHEILVSRMIDRPIRPLFPKGFYYEVQLMAIVMSMDANHPSDIVSMNAAFAALHLSGLPVSAQLGAVRVAALADKFIINPSNTDIAAADLDLIIAGTETAVTMIEGHAKAVSEEVMIEAIVKAHEAIKEIIGGIQALGNQVSKVKKPGAKKTFELFTYDKTLTETLRAKYYNDLRPLLEIRDKKEREHAFANFVEKVKEAELAEHEEHLSQIPDILVEFQSEILRKMILDEDKRSDGREMTELRPISCSANILKKAHGSGLFTRGETQALGVVSLGSAKNKQRVDLVSGTNQKRFLLHYNFPPFSVGEVGRQGFVGRREIGHGMLAERSLAAVLPKENDFDYTIRLVSEILESNGSSSMATICAGSIALMQAGVPVTSHVAGISMGLVLAEEAKKYKILTDIQGLEDHLGDMDFKVAGTLEGITGFQLDIKVQGITVDIMREALAAAKKARLEILSIMEQTIKTPGPLSANAPKCEVINIQSDRIRLLVGAGGKTIKHITEQTNSEIDIEDDGTVKIFAADDEVMEKTKLMVESAIGRPRIGTIFEGKIKRIVPFGLFVEIITGVDGLCHISNLSNERIADINKSFSEGQLLFVKVASIDNNGRISLTCKDIKESDKASATSAI
ncbi:polyribonucleotide nucleotidyltransferase [Spirochaetota bacterium]|nr:polyribonucleotide nucleotidyltransferase [Spirochaetota bacterium]